jgi:hypothetical protein
MADDLASQVEPRSFSLFRFSARNPPSRQLSSILQAKAFRALASGYLDFHAAFAFSPS